MDDFFGWFETPPLERWEQWFPDDPTTGPIDEWGTGSPGDLSPGAGNRWIERNTDSDDLLDLATDQVADLTGTAGAIVGSGVRGAFGVTPLTLAVIAGAGYLIFTKARK